MEILVKSPGLERGSWRKEIGLEKGFLSWSHWLRKEVSKCELEDETEGFWAEIGFLVKGKFSGECFFLRKSAGG